jgi:hypothetical protein
MGEGKFEWGVEDIEILYPIKEGGPGSGRYPAGSGKDPQTSDRMRKDYSGMDPIQLHRELSAEYHVQSELKITGPMFIKMKDGKEYQVAGRTNLADNTIEIDKDAFLIADNTTVLDAMGSALPGTARMGWQAVVAHETAHTIDMQRKNISAHDEFWNIHKEMKEGFGGKFVSKYARTHPTENFAESFAVYKIHPQWLEKNNPKMYNYMERLK